MKEALVLLGQLDGPTAAAADEAVAGRDREIRRMLVEAGLTSDAVYRNAA